MWITPNPPTRPPLASPVATQQHFGALIRQARTARELSQPRLGQLAGLSLSTITKFEREAEYPGEPESLAAVIRALHRRVPLTPGEVDRLAGPLGETRAALLPESELFPPAGGGLGDPTVDDLVRRLLNHKSRDFVIGALETLLATAPPASPATTRVPGAVSIDRGHGVTEFVPVANPPQAAAPRRHKTK